MNLEAECSSLECYQVHINVADVNENQPAFKEDTYVFTIREDINPGSTVGVVSADDIDEEERLFYTFFAAVSELSLTRFSINSNNGV